MSTQKSFTVFGEPVEILLPSDPSVGFCTITQTCLPGGGPPPHMHTDEDEFFIPLYGSFEIFDGYAWKPLTSAGHFGPRGHVHTFRCAGNAEGKILITASAGHLPEYLEHISPLVLPQDIQLLIDISAGYGITFAGPGIPSPTKASELVTA